MPVKETSKAAYSWLKQQGLDIPSRERVFRALTSLGEATRRE